MKSSVLTVHNISQSFPDGRGNQVLALDKINLDVQKNEFVCLVGPSGCGKSTLLRLVAGLQTPADGTIELSPDVRLSMIFQNFALFPWLTVTQNIDFGLQMANEDVHKSHEVVKKLIEEMGLTEFADSHPKELSGGMKQRVGIARALAVNPSMLLLDEPFSALDAFTAQKLRAELLKIWGGRMAVLMVTHLVEEAVQIADRIIVLSARPGHILKEVKVDLPRPRQLRNEKFYKLVDQITKIVES